jgi:hypothetical protein
MGPIEQRRALNIFFGDLFSYSKFKFSEALPHWIHEEFHASTLEQLPRLSVSLLRLSAAKLGKGKSTADDHVLGEFVSDLDDYNMAIFVNIFKNRLLNKSGFELCWALHVVKLIEKNANTLRIDRFRPIALLPSIYKWFSIILGFLAGEAFNNIRGPQFAFRSSFQVTEVTFLLTNLIEKALEHGKPLFVADGDLEKAYDNTEFAEIVRGCLKAGVPRIVTAAWLRELAAMRSIFAISSSVQSDPLVRVRSLVQGDPSAPNLFNITIDIPLVKFVDECRGRKWGFEMDGDIISIVMFADNFWIFASTDKMLEDMLLLWEKTLGEHSHIFPMKEVVWSTTIPDKAFARVAPRGLPLSRRLQTEGFKALGSMITTNGRNTVDLDFRIGQFEKAIYANKKTLWCKNGNIKPKLQLFTQIMRTVLFWGAGNWVLTKRDLSRLKGVQQRLLRRIIRPRNPGGMDQDVFQHFARVVRGHKEACKFEDVVHMFFRLRFEWGGHLSRLRLVRPDSLTVRVMLWRNKERLQSIMELNGGSQLHGRRFCAWRWEALFERSLGVQWYKIADNRTVWQDLTKKFAASLSRPIPRASSSF